MGIVAFATIDLAAAQSQMFGFERRVFPIMAGQAQLRHVLRQQSGKRAVMRLMAAQAFTVLDRRVNSPGGKLLFQIGVAGQTQLVGFIEQQAFQFGHMGLVAGGAFALGHRLMSAGHC